MSEHEHVHSKDCSCGQEHHNHSGHRHDENGSCIPDDKAPGTVHTEYHLHDEARVISGRLTLTGAYDTVRKAVSTQLEQVAKAVAEIGGIVGHIKASCEVRTVEMFSVTESDVSVKTAPEQEIKINLAAIVFLIDPEQAEDLVRQALQAIRETVHI